VDSNGQASGIYSDTHVVARPTTYYGTPDNNGISS